jgi:hypothetical protein
LESFTLPAAWAAADPKRKVGIGIGIMVPSFLLRLVPEAVGSVRA